MTTPASTRLTVISVSYNSSHVMPAMLEAVSTTPGVEVIVVDNASSDDSVAVIRRDFPSVRVIENEQNAGFAVAVNKAARVASGEFILLLNPDARIARDQVEKCLSELDAQPNVAVLAPHLVQPVGRLRTMEAGRDPNVWRMFTHYAGLSRAARRIPALEGMYLLDGHVQATRQVSWVSGACMFVRREVWRELGGLTERWFMYAEDVDFCLRARDAGFDVVLLMGATGEHVMGGSSKLPTESRVPSSAWLINLFDLYKLRHRPSLVRSWAWRSVAALGMRSRAAAYRVKARSSPAGSVDWRGEAAKFDHHAREISRARLR